MHYPCAMVPGLDDTKVEDVPFTDTWAAMEACVDAGLAKNIGISSELVAAGGMALLVLAMAELQSSAIPQR